MAFEIWNEEDELVEDDEIWYDKNTELSETFNVKFVTKLFTAKKPMVHT